MFLLKFGKHSSVPQVLQWSCTLESHEGAFKIPISEFLSPFSILILFVWDATLALGFFKALHVVLIFSKVRTSALYSSLIQSLSYILYTCLSSFLYMFNVCNMNIFFISSPLSRVVSCTKYEFHHADGIWTAVVIVENGALIGLPWGWGISIFEKGPHVILLYSQGWTPLGWLLQLQLMVAMEKFGWRSAKCSDFWRRNLKPRFV